MNDPTVILHSSIDTSDPLDSKELKELNNKEGLSIVENYEAVMGYIIHSYIEYLISLRNMCETYSTMDKVKLNNNIWDIYKRYRKE